MLEQIKKPQSEFLDLLLFSLLDIDLSSFARITYFDSKQNVINYILIHKEISFIQIIIQSKDYNQNESFKTLKRNIKAIERKKTVKINKEKLSQIIQFNLIVFENNENFIRKESLILNDNNLLSVPCKIVLINLYSIMKKDKLTSEYELLVNLSSVITKYFS